VIPAPDVLDVFAVEHFALGFDAPVFQPLCADLPAFECASGLWGHILAPLQQHPQPLPLLHWRDRQRFLSHFIGGIVRDFYLKIFWLSLGRFDFGLDFFYYFVLV